MGRRRSTALEDLITVAAALPWWVGILLAAGSFLLLREVAGGEPATASGLDQIGRVTFQAAMIGAAKVGQWLLPGVFALGAVLSFVRNTRGRKLVERLGGGDARAPLTWREFEALVREIYRQQGYRVTQTPEGPDGGVDLVFTRDGRQFLVQCKHWQARLVDVKVVRELKGVVAARDAAGGAVVTSGDFTRDAVEFAEKARIDLIGGRRLQALAQQLSGSNKQSQDAVAHQSIPGGSVPDVPTCPQCSSVMVLRTAKRGRNTGQNFWGCPSYPECKGTRQVQQ